MMRMWLLDYLLNSSWQIPLIYLAAWCCSRVARPLGSRTVHRLWVAGLLLEVSIPACNLDIMGAVHGIWSMLHPSNEGLGTVKVLYGPALAAPRGFVFVLPPLLEQSLLAAYALVVAYCAVRLLWNVHKTARLASSARILEHGSVNLAVSSKVSSPVTVGVLRSLLIFPEGFQALATPQEMQAVVAHESAHMVRRDYLKNLVYQVISLPIAWHPALGLTRSRITETREMICDEMAAGTFSDNPQAYSRSLLRLASLLFEANPAKNFHAIGILDANIFERRIMNLMQPRSTVRPAHIAAIIALCVGITTATSASALALRVNLGLPTTAITGQDGKQIKVGAGIMAAQSELKKMPVYPAEAKAKKDTLDGPVVLDAIIGKDGMIKSLKVLKSLRADYDESALQAVKYWTYKPYLLNGEPTEVETTITVTYSIDHSQK